MGPTPGLIATQQVHSTAQHSPHCCLVSILEVSDSFHTRFRDSSLAHAPLMHLCIRCHLGPPSLRNQAMEVIKVVSGVGSPLTQRLLVYDALDCTFRVRRCTALRGHVVHMPAASCVLYFGCPEPLGERLNCAMARSDSPSLGHHHLFHVS
jgi:hypothetical protein